MRGSFSEVTILFLIFCYKWGESSQYGGVLVPSQTTNEDKFNKSEGDPNKPRISSLIGVKANTENDQLRLVMGETITEHFVASVKCFNKTKLDVIVSVVGNSEILQVLGHSNLTFTCEHNKARHEDDNNGATGTDSLKSGNGTTFLNREIVVQKGINLTLESRMIGTSSLIFKINDIDTDSLPTNRSAKIDVVVIRDLHAVDIAFLVSVYVLEILEMLTFGTQLDLGVVKHTLKTPIPLLIGLLCQYLVMPLISFAIAKAVAPDSLTAIGIFVAGVCPGGGSSNIYTFLLDGDLSLSITMTTLSTVLSLAMLPLWLYTLGGEFLQTNDLAIPYSDIIVTLSVILVPLSVGLLIRNKFPKVTDLIEKIMTVTLTILALILIATGVVSSLYLFKMFNLKIIIVGCLLPYVGFCIGAFIALILKQPMKRIKTIAIETGMQNTGIAVILLINSLPEPFGSIATVAPLSAEVMSPIPPFFLSLAYIIWKSCCKKYKKFELPESDRKVSEHKLHELPEADKENKQHGTNRVNKDIVQNDLK